MERIIINPAYKSLEQFISTIPSVFDTQGTLIYDERNQVRIFMVGEMKLVVKRFRRPLLHQRIDYTLFRPSKAKRAYLYGMKLVELGISTPTPIAYIETYHLSLFTQGYLVTEFCGDPDARIVREEPEKHDDLIDSVVRFIVRCHEKGFIHGDTNLSNFLYRKDASGYHVTTIDINRSHFFSNPSKEKCLESLFRLTHVRPVLTKIVRRYAELRGWDTTSSVQFVLEKLNKFERRKKLLKLHR